MKEASSPKMDLEEHVGGARIENAHMYSLLSGVFFASLIY